MNSSKRRSSRSRMENRLKKRSKPTPVILDSGDGKSYLLANRAARKQQAYLIAHAPGQSVRQQQRDKRKQNQTAARRAVRVIRAETKLAQRKSAGVA